MTIQDKIKKTLGAGNIDAAKRLLNIHFIESDRKDFNEVQQTEYNTLFMETIHIDDVIDPVTLEVLEPAYDIQQLKVNSPTFEDWKNETVSVLIDTVIKTDDNGVEYTEDIFEEQLVRPSFNAKPNYDIEIESYLNSSTIYKDVKSNTKEDSLNRATVIVNGKEFYVDPSSRIDISDAIGIAETEGLLETQWKLATGWSLVTLDELKQARKLALENKASIIGIQSVQ